jgi:hypothetical protein
MAFHPDDTLYQFAENVPLHDSFSLYAISVRMPKRGISRSSTMRNKCFLHHIATSAAKAGSEKQVAYRSAEALAPPKIKCEIGFFRKVLEGHLRQISFFAIVQYKSIASASCCLSMNSASVCAT